MAATLVNSEPQSKAEPGPKAMPPLANRGTVAHETEKPADIPPVPHVRSRKWLWVVGLVVAVAACAASVPCIQKACKRLVGADGFD